MKKTIWLSKNTAWVMGLVALLMLMLLPLDKANAQTIYKWKMAINSAENENYFRVASEAAQQVKAISGGRIEIQPYALNQVVPITEAWEAVDRGVMELALVFAGYHAGKLPVANVECGLPFTLKTELEQRMFWHDFGFLNFLNNEVYAKTNTHVLGQVYYSGYAFWLREPAHTIADLQHRKLRTAGALSKIMGKLDIPATFIPGAELYTALATGVLDGAAYGSLVTGNKMKLYEVAKYVLDPKVQDVAACTIYINKKLFDKLPEDLKELMNLFALKINDGLNRDFDLGEVTIIDNLKKKHGLQVSRLENDAYEALGRAAADYRNDLAGQDPLSAKAIKMLNDFMETVRAK